MGLVMELWKLLDDGNRKDPKEHTVRSKVEKRGVMADEAVVVLKFL
jgi:hypothetical protein